MLPIPLRNLHRLEMCLADLGLPEVLLLGRYNYVRAESSLPEHTHGETLEICYLAKGRQTYEVHGRNYYLKGGDVFVAFPKERHSSAGHPQEKGILYWIMIRKMRRSFLGLPVAESERLWKSLCGLSSRHFRGSHRLLEHLDNLTLLFHGSDDPLRVTKMRSELLGFVLEFLKCAEVGEVGGVKSVGMGSVVQLIHMQVEETLSVPDLAAKAGLSTARFKARFKEETGVPPGEFVLRTKIEEAKKRLLSGKQNVTEVAYALGFSSSQYFATVFKRFTRLSPSEYAGEK